MSNFLTQVRKWLGLDNKDKAQDVPEEELVRAEGEGMTPPDVETPSPQVDQLPEEPARDA